jgi:hypothetical protein
MNKGYAFGFLIIILVLILGFYVAYTGFTGSRAAIRAGSESASASGEVAPTSAPAQPSPTPTATILVIPTPVPGLTATLTAMVSAGVTEPPPTDTPLPPPTEPPQVLPTITPAPIIVQPPTPAPAPAYQFRVAGPPAADPAYQLCCYIYGTIRSASGAGIEGIRVQAFNEWNALPPAVTKSGGEAGQYNIPIGSDPVTWYIIVVDGAGNQISSQVQIQFDANVANGYRVDWQRTF